MFGVYLDGTPRAWGQILDWKNFDVNTSTQQYWLPCQSMTYQEATPAGVFLLIIEAYHIIIYLAYVMILHPPGSCWNAFVIGMLSWRLVLIFLLKAWYWCQLWIVWVGSRWQSCMGLRLIGDSLECATAPPRIDVPCISESNWRSTTPSFRF